MGTTETKETTIMEQFDKRKGIFRPLKLDDLVPGANKCIGMYCEWEALWVIEVGQYKGQWAMAPKVEADDFKHIPFACVPECDIDFK